MWTCVLETTQTQSTKDMREYIFLMCGRHKDHIHKCIVQYDDTQSGVKAYFGVNKCYDDEQHPTLYKENMNSTFLNV